MAIATKWAHHRVTGKKAIVVGGASVMGPSAGGLRTRVTRCSETAMRLPIRSRNGTPRQRSVSTHILAAMNASFDPAAVAENAILAVETGQGPLILSPAVPLESARQLIRRLYTQVTGRTIQHHQGVFYLWDGTHYH